MPELPAERLHELSGRQISHYELGPVLARGQTGLLFRAFDNKHHRPAAFKILWPRLTQDADAVRRFVRAMRTILRLRHPNLVALYGAGKAAPYCWLAMEYVDGRSVAEVLGRPGRRPDWRLALRVTVHLGRALAYAHGRQIVHRNVTPRNVLLDAPSKTAKLGDVMLAKALEGKLADQLTRPGEVLGDVPYLSPERTTGGLQASDARSDLYSLGATAYALLTGRPPLQGASFVETVLKIRQEAPVAPRKLNAAVPAAFEAMVLKLLAKRPEERFQTAREVLNGLKPLLHSLGK